MKTLVPEGNNNMSARHLTVGGIKNGEKTQEN